MHFFPVLLIFPLWHMLKWNCFNSLRSSDSYMHHRPWPSLVQIMACRLFGAKPLSELMLYHCQLDLWEQTSVKMYSKLRHFHSRKCIWKWHLENVIHFISASVYEFWWNLHDCLQWLWWRFNWNDISILWYALVVKYILIPDYYDFGGYFQYM